MRRKLHCETTTAVMRRVEANDPADPVGKTWAGHGEVGSKLDQEGRRTIRCFGTDWKLHTRCDVVAARDCMLYGQKERGSSVVDLTDAESLHEY